MAVLQPCAACGHEVSPYAKACPSCGHPVAPAAQPASVWHEMRWSIAAIWVAGVLLLLAWIFGWI